MTLDFLEAHSTYLHRIRIPFIFPEITYYQHLFHSLFSDMDELFLDISHEWMNYFRSLRPCRIHHQTRDRASEPGSLACCCIESCAFCVFHQPIDFRWLSQKLQYAIRFYPSICEIAAATCIDDPKWRMVIHSLPDTIKRDFNGLLLNSGTLGQLVSVSGIAISASETVQLPIGIEFKCTKCGNLFFSKMVFPGIIRFPSPYDSDLATELFSLPPDVHGDEVVSAWKAKLATLLDAQRRMLQKDLGSFFTKSVLHGYEKGRDFDKILKEFQDAKCTCVEKKGSAGFDTRKFVPLQHRTLYVDAQLLKVQEDTSGAHSAQNERAKRSRKNSESESASAATQVSMANAATIDVLVIGSEGIRPDLSPGKDVTVTGVLTIANAVVELLKRGGSLKRIGQGTGKSSLMPDMQHHPGDFTTGPKSVMLLGSHIAVHADANSAHEAEAAAEFDTVGSYAVPRGLPAFPVGANLERALVDLFCPGIVGHHNIKLAALLCAITSDQRAAQLTASNPSFLFDNPARRTHGPSREGNPPMHMLMLGPAGIGKSQLLKFASNALPRSVFVCGPTLTPSGLGVGWAAQGGGAAGAQGHARLEAGALIVADGGLCCIDEIDKMPLPAQNVLHEVIDQGTLTVSKASVLHTLSTSARVIAAGNIENVHNIAPELLSRFSLIFCLSAQTLQKSESAMGSEQKKRDLLLSVLGAKSSDAAPDGQSGDVLFSQKPHSIAQDTHSGDKKLQSYVFHLRNMASPPLAADAKAAITEWYLQQRQRSYASPYAPRKVTPRDFLFLYQTVCALAKLRGKACAGRDEVQAAVDLMDSANPRGLRNALLTPAKSKRGGQPGKRFKKAAMAQIFLDGVREKCGPAGKSRQWSESELLQIYEACFEEKLANKDANLTPFPILLESLNMQGALLKAGSSKFRLG